MRGNRLFFLYRFCKPPRWTLRKPRVDSKHPRRFSKTVPKVRSKLPGNSLSTGRSYHGGHQDVFSQEFLLVVFYRDPYDPEKTHGTNGIFTYRNGCFFGKCRLIYHIWMRWVLALCMSMLLSKNTGL